MICCGELHSLNRVSTKNPAITDGGLEVVLVEAFEFTERIVDDITAGEQRKGDGSYQGWSQVAAETINGQNKVIWTHQDGRMSEWNVDNNWNLQRSTVNAPGSNGFFSVESSFNMDFNNDDVIGIDPLA